MHRCDPSRRVFLERPILGPVSFARGIHAAFILKLAGPMKNSRLGSLTLFAICVRVRHILFALLALVTTAHAQSVVFTYDQWERLSPGLQEIYISGAIDAVSTITTPPSAATAKYYNDCLVKKEIKAHDIVEEMKVAVRSRPELYPKPATGALLAALIKLCGQPNPWPK